LRVRDAIRRLHPFSFLFVVLLSVVLPNPHGILLAQNREQTPTISSNVDEVSLDLVVRSRNKPVLDLTPEDFVVTDAGTAVKVSSLNLVDKNAEPRLFTLVFDRFDSAASANARKIASKILKEIPEAGFALSVLSVQGQLRLSQEFTSDRAAVNQAITLATQDLLKNPADEAPLKHLVTVAKRGRDLSGRAISPEQRLRAQVLLAAMQESQYIQHEAHSNPALAGLLALVRSERRLPGLKIVFFITQDPSSGFKDGDTMEKIVSAANRSAVHIVAIDANTTNEETKQYMQSFTEMRSVMAMKDQTGIAQQNTPATGAATQAPAGPSSVQNVQTPMGAMGSTITPTLALDRAQYERLDVPGSRQTAPICRVAKQSGGVCVTAGESPEHAVRELVQDMTSYYEASFVPAIKQYDGKFHAIKVKSTRRGLNFKARAGYFALPPEPEFSIQAFEAPLLNVLAQPTLPNDLQFQSRVLQLGESEDGNTNVLVIQIPLTQLETRDDPNSNLYSAHVSILAQIRDKSGQIIQHFAEDIPQHGALDQKQRGAGDDIRLQCQFVADPGQYTAEVAVVDRNSGKTAAQRSTIQISDASQGPFLSDLSLVARSEPLALGSDSSEVLKYGDARIVPELAHEVSKAQKQIFIFSILQTEAQSKDRPQLQLKLVRNGESMAQVPLPLKADQSTAALPYVASIQTSSLPAGSYQIIETLTQGGSVAEKNITFEIPGPEFASALAPTNVDTSSAQSIVSDQSLRLDDAKAALSRSSALTITEIPAASVNKPSQEAVDSLVAAAAKYALKYSKSLPNFVCMEMTKRSVENNRRGDWKLRDSYTELLRYDGHQESRTLLHSDGKQGMGENGPDTTLPVSTGEFGGLLNLVFRPESKTSFQWQSPAHLGDETMQVVKYVVSPENATMGLRDSNSHIFGVGAHGLLYIDAATGGVRRITLEADKIPAACLIHFVGMMVDYEFVTIGTHEYLLPVRAAVSVKRGNKRTELNEISFRNYRRFASQAKVVPTN